MDGSLQANLRKQLAMRKPKPADDEAAGAAIGVALAERAAGGHDALRPIPRRHRPAAGHVHPAAKQQRPLELAAEEEVA